MMLTRQFLILAKTLIFITLLKTAFTENAPVCFNNKKLCFSATVDSKSDLVVLKVNTTVLPKGWVSIGLGSSMSKANVWMIYGDNPNNIKVSDRMSTQKTVPNVVSSSSISLLSTPQIQSDTYMIQFTRNQSEHQFKFTNTSQSFIWAIAESAITATDNNLPMHTSEGVFAYNVFLSSGESSAGWITPHTALKIHKVSMGVAWNFLAGLAIFTARFFKFSAPKYWFYLHVFLFVGTIILTTVGFIFIWIAEGSLSFDSAHGIIGIILFVLIYLQFILGILIHKLFNPKRSSVPIRDKMHWFLGYITYVMAMANIFLGIQMSENSTAWLIFSATVYAAFLIAFIVAQIKIGQQNEVKANAIAIRSNDWSS